VFENFHLSISPHQRSRQAQIQANPKLKNIKEAVLGGVEDFRKNKTKTCIIIQTLYTFVFEKKK
jgi:hypothetical protein